MRKGGGGGSGPTPAKTLDKKFADEPDYARKKERDELRAKVIEE